MALKKEVRAKHSKNAKDFGEERSRPGWQTWSLGLGVDGEEKSGQCRSTTLRGGVVGTTQASNAVLLYPTILAFFVVLARAILSLYFNGPLLLIGQAHWNTVEGSHARFDCPFQR